MSKRSPSPLTIDPARSRYLVQMAIAASMYDLPRKQQIRDLLNRPRQHTRRRR